MKVSLSLCAVVLAQAASVAAAPRCRIHKSSAAPGPSAAASAHPVVSVSAVASAYPVASASIAPSKAAPPAASAYPSASAPGSAPSKGVTPPSSGGPTSGGKAMIDSINEYRKRANLPLLTWSSKLAANAQKTCTDSIGKGLVHQLNDGSFGQVMAPGFDDGDKCDKDTKSWTPFEVSYYSWLCEREQDPALGGICPQIWNISHIDDKGQTGHHDILADKDYKTIGCAYVRDPKAAACGSWPGIWTCDTGY